MDAQNLKISSSVTIFLQNFSKHLTNWKLRRNCDLKLQYHDWIVNMKSNKNENIKIAIMARLGQLASD